jgi:hypothetical protein
MLTNVNKRVLWQYIIAGTKGHFEGHTHPQQLKNYTRLFGGLSVIRLTRWCGVQGLLWGARGPFLPTAAMVVAVVMPVVFVLRRLKSAIKTLKLLVCKHTSLFFTIHCKTYYNSRNTNCSVAGAQTSLVQWNPGISGITGKLIPSPRRLGCHV